MPIRQAVCPVRRLPPAPRATVSGGGGASGAGAGKQTVSIDERSSEQKEKDEKEHRMQVMLVKKVHEKFEIDMDAPGIYFPLNHGNAQRQKRQRSRKRSEVLQSLTSPLLPEIG